MVPGRAGRWLAGAILLGGLAAGPAFVAGYRSGRLASVAEPAAAPLFPSSPSTAPAPRPAKEPVRSFNWRDVESPDYRQYIANLRAIGCPAETIRDIVVADVQQLYSERIRAAREQFGEYEFWRHDRSGHWLSTVQSEIVALRAEERDVLQQLLGVDAPLPAALADDELADFDPRVSFISSAQQKTIRDVERQFHQRLALALDGHSLPDCDDPLPCLRAEREAALDRVLTPNAREEYELRVSPVADGLRTELAGVAVNENEFRALFRLRRELERQFPSEPFDFLNSSRTRARTELAVQMDAEAARILGEDRYRQLRENRLKTNPPPG